MDFTLNLIRNIAAVVVGLVLGGIINWYIGILNTQIFPLPEGETFLSLMEDSEALKAWIESLPQTAFILVLVAHLSQAFFGGYIAALISKRNVMCAALVVGGVSLLAGLMNMASIPAPLWLWVEMPLYLLVAWYASKLELMRRNRKAAPLNQ